MNPIPIHTAILWVGVGVTKVEAVDLRCRVTKEAETTEGKGVGCQLTRICGAWT
jgi:hypothetical protein